MSCPEFVANAFAVRTSTHTLHLMQKSYARHVALQEFYEGLVDLVDAYAEVYIAEEGIPKFPAVKPPTGAPTDVLQQFLLDVRAELKEEGAHATKQTILADIEQLTLRALYKLRTLA